MSSNVTLKLLKIIKFKVNLTTVTGLLISAGRALGRIGGADVEPMSIEREYQCIDDKGQLKLIRVRVPYIPGSSLKGRMRSLLEVALGLPLYSSDGKIWSHTPARTVQVNTNGDKITDAEFVEVLIDTELDRMFGYGAFPMNEVYETLKKNNSVDLMNNLLPVLTPTLIQVDDFFPDNNLVCNIYRENELVTFDDFIEDKNENRLDRVTSAADPRTVSRVKPGVTFTGSISFLVYDKNFPKFKDYLNLLTKGMRLLEMTYLGAAGSRGYGRIKFSDISVSIYDAQSGTDSVVGSYNSLDDLINNVQTLVNFVQTVQATKS
ncbi:type III-A CRISPR-associated RAMP protein Csm3 [Candidatus Marsarchaeota G2 archaeon BE_D]|jgi:CRISPR-associated protein Csm3|uniref:CRISPR system Cms endoribonuclease Csm3 n=1 Tax=Candidatus Marsarchaeota G2 archaeon BE_D TaxID=1978158 RepID=A0A2R6CD70_9ARCH|nr:MAG: type III-A CRISPR-associated RAMP protein Csm3 [Candidatus Marsarchaeota G2 archaeon BE_D]